MIKFTEDDIKAVAFGRFNKQHERHYLGMILGLVISGVGLVLLSHYLILPAIAERVLVIAWGIFSVVWMALFFGRRGKAEDEFLQRARIEGISFFISSGQSDEK
jgi:tellurite resistance protein TehA-like permease